MFTDRIKYIVDKFGMTNFSLIPASEYEEDVDHNIRDHSENYPGLRELYLSRLTNNT